MIPLAGSKQAQCAAETSRIQQATNRGPKISLMFTPSGQQRLEYIACEGKGYFARQGLNH